MQLPGLPSSLEDQLDLARRDHEAVDRERDELLRTVTDEELQHLEARRAGRR